LNEGFGQDLRLTAFGARQHMHDACRRQEDCRAGLKSKVPTIGMLKKRGRLCENTGALAVGFAPVRHTDYINYGLVVINRVDDAVVADSNTPKLTSAFELLRAVWARVAAESENRGVDPLSDDG
jgi:hypothetical protein